MEDDHKTIVQPEHRLNPNMNKDVKEEVVRLFDVNIIYLISNSPWVNSIQVVPKKGGIMVVENYKKELVPTRTVTRWRVCIDYRILKKASTISIVSSMVCAAISKPR